MTALTVVMMTWLSVYTGRWRRTPSPSSRLLSRSSLMGEHLPVEHQQAGDPGGEDDDRLAEGIEPTVGGQDGRHGVFDAGFVVGVSEVVARHFSVLEDRRQRIADGRERRQRRADDE